MDLDILLVLSRNLPLGIGLIRGMSDWGVRLLGRYGLGSVSQYSSSMIESAPFGESRGDILKVHLLSRRSNRHPPISPGGLGNPQSASEQANVQSHPRSSHLPKLVDSKKQLSNMMFPLLISLYYVKGRADLAIQ
jgi:hypothetical protein